jgi:hypothetical protein
MVSTLETADLCRRIQRPLIEFRIFDCDISVSELSSIGSNLTPAEDKTKDESKKCTQVYISGQFSCIETYIKTRQHV